MDPRAPSGLFPSGPPRPTFREPHPVRFAAVLAGAAAGAAWMAVFGVLAIYADGHYWVTMAAAVIASLAAVALARFGDRGAAVGAAMSIALGVAIEAALVIHTWATVGWPLW